MTAPLVGISSYAEPAQWGPWQLPCALLPLGYAEQVAAAGGVPVLLPPLPRETAAVDRLDGVILSGGGDLDPAGYGAQPHPETSRVQPARDRAELDLLAAALAAGLPVLAICRGLQILNVSRGGTLRQHLPDGGGHRAAPGTFGTHPVRVAPAAGWPACSGRRTPAASCGSTCPPRITRPSAGWAPGWWPPRGPRTALSRRPRRPIVTNFSSPCSGTPSRARIRGCSALSSRRPGTGCQATRSQYPPSL